MKNAQLLELRIFHTLRTAFARFAYWASGTAYSPNDALDSSKAKPPISGLHATRLRDKPTEFLPENSLPRTMACCEKVPHRLLAEPI